MLLPVGTWLVLGLDYLAHLATVAVVLLGWARMRRVSCRPTTQQGAPMKEPS
ncbi:MAG TPA: hypothetical protein VGP53_02065 [Acidimicrobiales bacterium]|nr:hypothetical protein [Acidimicrobiales bacterium]